MTHEKHLEEVRQSLEYKAEVAKLDFVSQTFDVMERLDINQAELARRLGCSRAWVSKFLHTNANPTIETMVKIAETLGGSLEVKMKVPRKRRASGGTVVRMPQALAAKSR